MTFFGRHFPPSRMKPALHFPFAAANTPKVRFGNVSTQLSVPGSLTCSLSVIVKLGECSVALTALKVAILALGAGLGGGLGGGDAEGLGAGEGVIVSAGLTPKDWTACGAASYVVSPAWLATSVHVPWPTNVTVEPEEAPDSVQTPGVAEARAGARLE